MTKSTLERRVAGLEKDLRYSKEMQDELQKKVLEMENQEKVAALKKNDETPLNLNTFPQHNKPVHKSLTLQPQNVQSIDPTDEEANEKKACPPPQTTADSTHPPSDMDQKVSELVDQRLAKEMEKKDQEMQVKIDKQVNYIRSVANMTKNSLEKRV